MDNTEQLHQEVMKLQDRGLASTPEKMPEGESIVLFESAKEVLAEARNALDEFLSEIDMKKVAATSLLLGSVVGEYVAWAGTIVAGFGAMTESFKPELSTVASVATLHLVSRAIGAAAHMVAHNEPITVGSLVKGNGVFLEMGNQDVQS